jgi:hypothetical protein
MRVAERFLDDRQAGSKAPFATSCHRFKIDNLRKARFCDALLYIISSKEKIR